MEAHMTTTPRFLVSSLIALLVGTSCLATQADARRFGGAHARAHVAGHNMRFNHRARVANRIDRRGHRRGHWVNGVWIAGAVATGVAVGAAAASDSCAYYWNQWKATGSGYWRDKYYNNCG
jgi:hypothetical protein